MNYVKAKELFELYLVISALDRSGWTVTGAAADLGITRQAVFKTIKKHGLKRGAKPPSPAAFLFEAARPEPVRRVVLFDGSDFAWLQSKRNIASYSKLVRAALRLLKKKADREISGLI